MVHSPRTIDSGSGWAWRRPAGASLHYDVTATMTSLFAATRLDALPVYNERKVVAGEQSAGRSNSDRSKYLVTAERNKIAREPSSATRRQRKKRHFRKIQWAKLSGFGENARTLDAEIERAAVSATFAAANWQSTCLDWTMWVTISRLVHLLLVIHSAQYLDKNLPSQWRKPSHLLIRQNKTSFLLSPIWWSISGISPTECCWSICSRWIRPPTACWKPGLRPVRQVTFSRLFLVHCLSSGHVDVVCRWLLHVAVGWSKRDMRLRPSASFRHPEGFFRAGRAPCNGAPTSVAPDLSDATDSNNNSPGFGCRLPNKCMYTLVLHLVMVDALMDN